MTTARQVGRAQADVDDAGNGGKTGLALEAERLQRIGIGGTTHQEVCTDADTDGRIGAEAAVLAGERARSDAVGRGVDGPGEAGLLGDAEVETVAMNAGDVRLGIAAVIAAEDALQLGRRTDDEADVLTALAFENARLNALGIGGCE